MANTKSLTREERKNKKRKARKRLLNLFTSLAKGDRKRFLTQIRDRRAKSKEGIVAFTTKLKQKEETKTA